MVLYAVLIGLQVLSHCILTAILEQCQDLPQAPVAPALGPSSGGRSPKQPWRRGFTHKLETIVDTF